MLGVVVVALWCAAVLLGIGFIAGCDYERRHARDRRNRK